MNWLDRKRREFGQFDLSALNVFGWLLFLSAIGLIGVGIYFALDGGFEPNTGAGTGARAGRAKSKLLAAAMILAAIAWYQIGKLLLGRVGVSIYKAAKEQEPSS